jgi:hypothetical protein
MASQIPPSLLLQTNDLLPGVIIFFIFINLYCSRGNRKLFFLKQAQCSTAAKCSMVAWKLKQPAYYRVDIRHKINGKLVYNGQEAEGENLHRIPDLILGIEYPSVYSYWFL